jgi:hypothetical protein
VLVPTEPIARLLGGDGFHQRQPTLAYTSEAHDQLTVASEWFVVEAPEAPPSELRHTTFRPWGDEWPVDGNLAPTYLADLDAGVSFAAAESTNGRLALLMSDGGKPQPPQGVRFSLDFGPGSGNVPPKYDIDAEAHRALFATLGSDLDDLSFHLVGMTFSGVPLSAATSVVQEVDNGIVLAGPAPLGCADNPISADAVAIADGWVLAASSAPGRVADPCVDPGSAGPATTVYTAQADVRGGVSVCNTIDASSTVVRVVTAPHPSGAWAVWSSDDDGIRAARVGFDGCVLGDFSIKEPGHPFVTAQTLGAGQLAGLLVVAYVLIDINNATELVVRVLDETGIIVFEARHQQTALAPDPIDVLGSPDGDAFVIAWSEYENGAARVRVARYGCP